MRFLLLSTMLVIALPAGRVLRAQAAGGAHANHAEMQTLPPTPTMTALLTSPLGSRAESGAVSVTGTTVQMTWVGGAPGAMRTWSVRRGTCSRDEGLLDALNGYAPITLDDSGRATRTATLDRALSADATFHVLVQTPDAAPAATARGARTVACGALNVPAPAVRAPTERTDSPNGSKSSTVDHAAMDHSMMDHSGMNMSGMSMSATSPSASPGGSTGVDLQVPSKMMPATSDSMLMAIHKRMMADPVIQERVLSDPVLLRMMAQIPAMEASVSATQASPAESAKTPRKPAAKPVAKPSAKPVSKPTPAAMPGMDHSKMPGMGKPPV